MTSEPAFPGAPAVVLWREDIAKDESGNALHYERIKILTAAGRKYGSIAINLYQGLDAKEISSLAARTIHTDGSVVPFTGKPYQRALQHGRGYQIQQTVLNLPAVEVGSILELYYVVHHRRYAEPPAWDIQGELPVLRALYVWVPSYNVQDEGREPLKAISWLSHLPDGVKVEHNPGTIDSRLLSNSTFKTLDTYVVRVEAVAPIVVEELMPPMSTVAYSVRFSYTAKPGAEAYWTGYGQMWSKSINALITPDTSLRQAVEHLTSDSANSSEKLKHIYSAVQSMNRIDGRHADSKTASAAEVWKNKQGTPNELAGLFLAMARSAGFTAYALKLPDRSQSNFEPQWMNGDQLTDVLALVVVDGKEVAFDPGAPFCSFGRLAWQHTGVSGLRQTDKGAVLAKLAPVNALINRTSRIATLTVSEKGLLTGTLEWNFEGDAAQEWRSRTLELDAPALKDEMQRELEASLPEWLHITSFDLSDTGRNDRPIHAAMQVDGHLQVSGSRWFLAADPFVARSERRFTAATRATPVMFPYPSVIQDKVKLTLQGNLRAEAELPSASFEAPGYVSYNLFSKADHGVITVERRLVTQAAVIPADHYAALRELYSHAQSSDAVLLLLNSSVTPRSSVEE